MRWIKQYWWAWGIGLIITFLVGLTVRDPHYQTFGLYLNIKQWLKLLLGGLYTLSSRLLDSTMIFSPLVVVIFAGLIIAVRVLWKQRRIPTLIPLVTLLAINTLFYGAFQFVVNRERVWQPIDNCRYPITPDNHIRIIYYPVERQLEYGEQQFFLMSYNGGLTWEQVFDTYAIEPSLSCNQHLQPLGDGEMILQFERRVDGKWENERVIYYTQDAGVTWQRIEGQQHD